MRIICHPKSSNLIFSKELDIDGMLPPPRMQSSPTKDCCILSNLGIPSNLYFLQASCHGIVLVLAIGGTD